MLEKGEQMGITTNTKDKVVTQFVVDFRSSVNRECGQRISSDSGPLCVT